MKDKVKGIFGISTTRLQSKQAESKPSEFIITLDILKVRDDLGVFLFFRLDFDNLFLRMNAVITQKTLVLFCIFNISLFMHVRS